MVKDVIAAVEYLHSRNPPIVHRDIKPENLLLDKNNKIKLAGKFKFTHRFWLVNYFKQTKKNLLWDC